MPIEIFLHDAVSLLAASIAVLLVCNRFRIPSIVGFLLTGLLIGPSGLRLVARTEQVELFAEIGVVFLLFSIGLEFSLERLRQIRRFFFLGGFLQTGLTTAVTALLAIGAGFGLPRAIFLGFLAALSSTAILLTLYGERRELDAPQGKILIGMLLFQDFLIVPMIVLTPVLGGAVQASAAAVAGRFAVALLAVALVFVVARYLMPRLLHLLVRTRIREILVLGALLVCLGMAWLTETFEFSLALGAFIAGIIISESEYSHQVVAEVTPFRDVFNSLFFISIGMLLDLRFALDNAGGVLALAGTVLAVKSAAAGTAAALLGFSRRIVTIVGLALAQVGEFSFVLLEVGRTHGLVDGALYQTVIAASVLTMLATPALVSLAPALGSWPSRAAGGAPAVPAGNPGSRPLRNHVIVVGLGVNGRNLSRVLKSAGIPYVALELDPDIGRRARAEGQPVIYGDATRREILESAGISRASVIVFAISDREAVRRAIRFARELHPGVHIIVRTRLVDDIEDLERRGADEVIAEEFETSIEIFTRVLRHFRVPRNIILAETRALRGESYRMLRSPGVERGTPEALLALLSAGTTDIFRVEPEGPAAGRSLRDLDLRKRTGATILAVVRGERPITSPSPDLLLEAGDDLVLMGSHAAIESAFDTLEAPPPGLALESSA
ncbi:MAG TPA: cation:proton antiporter [Thermoanaerobaculia bacterium]|nr:cation:proton antiporter [Thermoanaerobaculia bacterium]